MAFGAWATASIAIPPLSTYGNLPGFEDAALSPSGERVAMIGMINDHRYLIVLDEDAKPLLTFQIGDQKLGRLRWGGNDRVLLEMRHTDNLGIGFTAEKAEFSDMLVIPLDGKAPRPIFYGSRSVKGGIRGFFGTVERDGRWFGYFGGITLTTDAKSDPILDNTNSVLYEVDLESGDIKRIANRADEGIRRSWKIDTSGKVAVTFDYISSSGEWRIRNSDGKLIASGRNPLGNVGLVSFGRTPDTIIYDRIDENGAEHWFETPITGGTATEILEDEDKSLVYIDDRSRLLIGYQRNGDVRTSQFFGARAAKVMAATARAFPGLNLQLVDWNDRFDRLIVKTDGPGDPGTWWIVNISTGQATILGTSYPMSAADVGPVKMFHYKAADGLDISGVLTLPPNRSAKDLPIVILPHGGSTARSYPEFNWWAQAFAARGYAVFEPNFRGSSGYGAAFEKAGHGEWGRKMQSDISDGVAALAQAGIANPKRACIMGGSYGGYAALAGVTLQHGLYRCAVSVAGISDLPRLYQTKARVSDYDETLIRAMKEEIGSGHDLTTVSPIKYADRADAPILLVHGKDDTVVDYDQSAAMDRALRNAGKPVELVTLPNEDHWLSRSATRLAMLQAALAFVEKYNPPDAVK
jgi:dipeptidyl aminopeptidase/acylaminoacyl peptidase